MSGKGYGCPIEALMDAVGGKWKPVILYHLMGGTRRFGELRRLVPGVSQRMLTQHLRELEVDGIVHREVYREVPPKVEYSLTGLGRTLEPVLLKMNEWAEEHMVGRAAAGPDAVAAAGS
jgi:DNA-binding HxlR family transcriptional regulator